MAVRLMGGNGRQWIIALIYPIKGKWFMWGADGPCSRVYLIGCLLILIAYKNHRFVRWS